MTHAVQSAPDAAFFSLSRTQSMFEPSADSLSHELRNGLVTKVAQEPIYAKGASSKSCLKQGTRWFFSLRAMRATGISRSRPPGTAGDGALPTPFDPPQMRTERHSRRAWKNSRPARTRVIVPRRPFTNSVILALATGPPQASEILGLSLSLSYAVKTNAANWSRCLCERLALSQIIRKSARLCRLAGSFFFSNGRVPPSKKRPNRPTPAQDASISRGFLGSSLGDFHTTERRNRPRRTCRTPRGGSRA